MEERKWRLQVIFFVQYKLAVDSLVCFVDVEWFLVKNNVIHDSELEEDPRSSGQSGSQIKQRLKGAQRSDYDSDDGDSD